ncbi:alpha-(1,3)-fucosyltransferase 10 isoform X1 [Leptinotarsa decemlineata]|uniref:alpha-(1,3)-fucosyltransferase 10 isoform X1 n=1 Tax=Leptinotarsa decemlineata TaxID=7539 RepID=UPI003D3072A6
MIPYSYLKVLKLGGRLSKILIGIFIIYHVIKIFQNNTKKVVLIWWTPFMPASNRIIKCYGGEYECIVTSDRSFTNHIDLGAFLIYGSHIENNDFPLPRTASWAIFHEESPKNYAPFLFEIQHLFNITSTFSRYSDFPITLQYLANLMSITDNKYYIPVEIKNTYLKTQAPVLYIQSDCDTPLGRDYLVKKLAKYVEIDSYGKCLKNKEFPKEYVIYMINCTKYFCNFFFRLKTVFPLDLYNNEYLEFISKYKFIIAFENAICDDYVTEKFWRPIIVGSIPIYLGAPNIEDWLPNEQSAILVKNFKNMKAVANFINILNKNDTLYESFLGHKLSGRITNSLLEENVLSQHPITGFECYVCKRVHENNFEVEHPKRNVYKCPKPIPQSDEENTWNQHWDIGKCQSKALELLLQKGKPYSNDEFEQLWKTFLQERTCYE